MSDCREIKCISCRMFAEGLKKSLRAVISLPLHIFNRSNVWDRFDVYYHLQWSKITIFKVCSRGHAVLGNRWVLQNLVSDGIQFRHSTTLSISCYLCLQMLNQEFDARLEHTLLSGLDLRIALHHKHVSVIAYLVRGCNVVPSRRGRRTRGHSPPSTSSGTRGRTLHRPRSRQLWLEPPEGTSGRSRRC